MCKTTIILLAVLSLFVFGCGNGGDEKDKGGSGNGGQPEGGGGGGTPPETGGGGGGTPPDDGGGSGGGTPPALVSSGVAGTYVLETKNIIEFMKSQAMESIPDIGDMGDMGDMGGMGGEEAKAALEKAKAEAMAQIKEMTANMNMKVVLSPAGTFTVTGNFMEGPMDVKGNYKVDGDKITFTATEEDGEKIEDGDVLTGTVKDGEIRMSSEDMPFEMVLKKQ